MSTTQTRSYPPPPIQFLLIDVESETGRDAGARDSLSLTLEGPMRLARIWRRTPRHSASVTSSPRSMSWATATTPPRLCL
jgi:hypothetical protein